MLARWLGVYPTITLIMVSITPKMLGHLPIPVVTFLASALLIPITHYIVFPLVEQVLKKWVQFPVTTQQARHKMAVLQWLITYPLFTATLVLLFPYLAGRIPLPAITLLVSLIVVSTQSFVIMPLLYPRIRNWMV